MDVVLGVAVTGPVAHLALIESGARGADVIDQSVVDLTDHPVEKLTETVVGTNRILADERHRLVATRLCWPDRAQADLLRLALEDSGVHDVVLLSESEAVSALMSAAGRPGGALVVDEGTGTLTAPGTGADETAALDTMMASLGGQSDDPTFTLARGAALAFSAVGAGDATALATAVGPPGDATEFVPAAAAGEQQLAYSMAGEPGPEFGDYVEDEDVGESEDLDASAGERPRLSRRSLLIGNAVIAFAVVGFASLAAAVAIAVRPTADQ